MLKWISGWKLWGSVASVFMMLLGVIKIQNMRVSAKEQEIEEMQEQIEQQAYVDEVKQFQALDLEIEEMTDEKLGARDSRLDGSTTYRM